MTRDMLEVMVTADVPTPPTPVTVDDRDRVADERDRTSDARDRSSQARDDRSEERDARAEKREHDSGQMDPAAAADRADARRDRQGSAVDRRRSEDDRDAASADRIRAAVERANLVVDGLTGAHQRAPGVAELEREMIQARRTGKDFVLAFLDVDGLKEVNDTQGHAAGDRLLKQLVRGVRGAVREYDLVIRYGGDEFVCGLLDIGLDHAANRFANIRKDLAGQRLAFSVGLAVLGGDDTLDDLIDRADAAMYEQRSSRARR